MSWINDLIENPVFQGIHTAVDPLSAFLIDVPYHAAQDATGGPKSKLPNRNLTPEQVQTFFGVKGDPEYIAFVTKWLNEHPDAKLQGVNDFNALVPTIQADYKTFTESKPAPVLATAPVPAAAPRPVAGTSSGVQPVDYSGGAPTARETGLTAEGVFLRDHPEAQTALQNLYGPGNAPFSKVPYVAPKSNYAPESDPITGRDARLFRFTNSTDATTETQKSANGILTSYKGAVPDAIIATLDPQVQTLVRQGMQYIDTEPPTPGGTPIDTRYTQPDDSQTSAPPAVVPAPAPVTNAAPPLPGAAPVPAPASAPAPAPAAPTGPMVQDSSQAYDANGNLNPGWRMVPGFAKPIHTATGWDENGNYTGSATAPAPAPSAPAPTSTDPLQTAATTLVNPTAHGTGQSYSPPAPAPAPAPTQAPTPSATDTMRTAAQQLTGGNNNYNTPQPQVKPPATPVAQMTQPQAPPVKSLQDMAQSLLATLNQQR